MSDAFLKTLYGWTMRQTTGMVEDDIPREKMSEEE